MRRVFAVVLASCIAVGTGLTTASAAGVRSDAAARCGVSASVERSLTHTAGTRMATAALRACGRQGGVRAVKAHPPKASRPNRAHAAAATIVVDDDGFATAADCNNGATEVLTTISAGLAAAVSGDTVLVCPGTYSGGLEVPDGVTLKGTGAPKPVVGCGPGFFGTTGAFVGFGAATIDGLDFEGSGTCNSGIQLYQSVGSTIKNNTINGSGIGIFGELMLGNQLGPDNSITASQSGIVTFLNDADTITDNYVGEVPNADIALLLGDAFSEGGSLIGDNSLTGGATTFYGVYLDKGDLTHAEGNDISGHAYGVWVQDSPDVSVTHNLIHDNDYGLVNIATNQCQQGRSGREPCDRIMFGGPMPDLVDASRNWWGSPSGPGDWGVGAGDEVSSEADFFPWALNVALTSFRACDKKITIPGNLKGTNKSDVLCGSGGADTINGRKGADLIIANSGNDVISGKEGRDAVIAGGGDDFINGNTEFDSIQGRTGDDDCWFNQDGGQTSSCETLGIGPS